MKTVLITNASTNVCVKANKVEITDFSFNLLFTEDNIWSKLIFSHLIGSAFKVLNDSDNNVVIALPLEGWGWEIKEVSDDDYLKLNEHLSPIILLENAINLSRDSGMCTRYFLVKRTDISTNETHTIVGKLKCERISNGVGVNVILTNPHREVFNVNQGSRVSQHFDFVNNLTEVYDFIVKLLIPTKQSSYRVISVHEVTSRLVDF